MTMFLNALPVLMAAAVLGVYAWPRLLDRRARPEGDQI